MRERFVRLAAAMAVVAIAGGCGSSASEDAAAQTDEAVTTAYAGKLEQVVCDVKRPLAQLKDHDADPVITEANHEAVLEGFAKLGCNAVRVGIDPRPSPSTFAAIYPQPYGHFLDAARARGFRVYANPLFRPGEACGSGRFCRADNAAYAKWIVEYVKKFQPHFVGPFNEPSPEHYTREDLVDIATRVRASLNADWPTLVGPDTMTTEDALGRLAGGKVASAVNVIGSHDVYDDAATAARWRSLAAAAPGKALWASECPRKWSDTSGAGEIGIKAAVEGGVKGVVLYMAFPRYVNDAGKLDDDGRTIAKNIVAN